MAASTGSKIDWLYPELLSKEGLIEILLQRFVKLPDNTENTTRDELLGLYYQFVIPRPQREYRQNRRGRDMAKNQILQNNKRKITGPDSSEPPANTSTSVRAHAKDIDLTFNVIFDSEVIANNN